MNSKLWIKKTLTLCLTAAIFAAYSMAALAASDRIVGEVSISGKNVQGEAPAVTINGEAAQNGRSIFSSSTIVTSPDASAIISVAKVGKIELAPGTTLALSFNENGFSGDLILGKVTSLGGSKDVTINTPNGKTVKLNAGESAVAGQTQTTDDNDGGAAWIWYAVIFGGAAAAILIAATTNNNNPTIGGNTSVVSAIR